jgi:hypothetical protein
MSARLDLNTRGATAYVRRAALQWVTQIALLTVRRAKELTSHPGTGKVKGKRVGPVVHSAPGQPPFKQTGRGRASITYEVDAAELTSRAGTNVDYMAAQERGSKRGLKPRPWLRPAAEWAARQMKGF